MMILLTFTLYHIMRSFVRLKCAALAEVEFSHHMKNDKVSDEELKKIKH
jgi:hypothetical protein